ncbi:hypothetical protein TPR58_20870 [Sphingomonas sp. HF-S3]|uniref:Uncharacterized protein n=1 Tax=Sphingomonas rustica TaxID=3103142 RepID=A0ABV0BDK0_9SPHN
MTMTRIGFFSAASVPAVIAAMRFEQAPDYLAVIPGILIGLAILGLIHKRRTACAG